MENMLKCSYFQGGSIVLLTSITSKKVRLHLMYALLTYFLVMLGSMGTGEDLFYKCNATSEEFVHSTSSFQEFLCEIWNNVSEFLLFKKHSYLVADSFLYFAS